MRNCLLWYKKERADPIGSACFFVRRASVLASWVVLFWFVGLRMPARSSHCRRPWRTTAGHRRTGPKNTATARQQAKPHRLRTSDHCRKAICREPKGERRNGRKRYMHDYSITQGCKVVVRCRIGAKRLATEHHAPAATHHQPPHPTCVSLSLVVSSLCEAVRPDEPKRRKEQKARRTAEHKKPSVRTADA